MPARFRVGNHPTEGIIVASKLLSTKEAAEFLAVSAAFLERDRWAGARIPYLKIGSRAVRYRLEDLEQYLNTRIRTNTSQGVDTCGPITTLKN